RCVTFHPVNSKETPPAVNRFPCNKTSRHSREKHGRRLQGFPTRTIPRPPVHARVREGRRPLPRHGHAKQLHVLRPPHRRRRHRDRERHVPHRQSRHPRRHPEGLLRRRRPPRLPPHRPQARRPPHPPAPPRLAQPPRRRPRPPPGPQRSRSRGRARTQRSREPTH